MKRQIRSVALVLCLCLSFQSAAYASQEGFSPQEGVLQEETSPEETLMEDVSSENVLTETVPVEGFTSGPDARDNTELTPAGVYAAMTALKGQDAYKEGTAWTNDEPYSAAKGYYHWKGGALDGKNISAVGCVAFAFILSDAAFGNLPARMYAAGGFSYEDIKVGDILRVNNDAHTVIVLEVSEAGVVVAEGNISTGDHKGKVHWGRTISRDGVMSGASHYITRYPEGYISPDDPNAGVSIGSGTLATGLSWNLTKAGTLTISGSGAMPDFGSAAEQPWGSQGGQIRKVVVDEGVTSIGACAFWDCGVLSAKIPSSVASIGNSAFRGSSIISVVIPSGVKTIGDSAFRECKNLSSVTVSEGLETIGQNAFRSCADLTAIALPATISSVGHGAFYQCTGMRSAVFAPGSGQVTLGNNLFTQCYSMARVILPKKIDCIGEGMFQNCHMLAAVEIPQGAASIGRSAFASSGVSAVVIPDSVTDIDIAAFSACPLTDIYFTGTEAQWSSIRKIGDTGQTVSKATIHYNYVPGAPADPDTPPTTPGTTDPGTTDPGTTKPGVDKPGTAEPAVSVSYRTHVQTYGWREPVSDGKAAGTTGKAKRLEGICISVSGASDLGIQYTTHIQSYGWLPWAGNGEVSGTEGEGKRLEAIKIQLTGADKDKYDIYYRVHAQSYGWLAWAKNGEAAGTEGYAKRLEAIQIQIVEKGKAVDTKAEGISSVRTETYIARSGASPVVGGEDTPNVVYKTHVQTYGWQGLRYNGEVSGTSGQAKRLEGICISLSNLPYSGGITYQTHIQSQGWQDWKFNGQMSGTSGKAKRLEAVRIRLTGEMEQHYDIYYRVHAQSYGWLAWTKNGGAAGTAGLSKRLEGIQIVLVPKGAAALANNYGGIVSANKLAFIKN